MNPTPCRLELTLLDAREVCPACGFKAWDHRFWPHKNPDHINYDRRKDPDPERRHVRGVVITVYPNLEAADLIRKRGE